jgi:predicted glycoside hydrolase/deacetylase ChbG (UPF0249 family)
MKKVIFTADDYGVFPAVNAGVYEAVKASKIHSVAAFTNFDGQGEYESAVENIKKLHRDFGDRVEIGCHLTITSGKPITDEMKSFACDKDGNFLTIDDFKNFEESHQLEALEFELDAQIRKMKDAGVAPLHLTNHHNSLNLFQHHFDVYMKVAKKHNLPIRSAYITPERKEEMYLFVLKLKMLNSLSKEDQNKIDEFSKIISEYQQMHPTKVPTTAASDGRHYGPIPQIPLMHILGMLTFKPMRKRRKLDRAIEELLFEKNLQSIEVIFHLADSNWLQVDKSRDLHYPGVDRNYFDSRVIELKSILGYDLSRFSGIEQAKWSALK